MRSGRSLSGVLAPSKVAVAALGLCLGLLGCGGGDGMEGQTAGSAGAPASGPCPDGAPTCIPAAVFSVLEAKCLGCHGDPPAMYVPMSLVTWEDFHGMHEAAQESNYRRTAARVRSELMPMPPARVSQLTAQERATLLGWVDRGAPSGP